MSTPRCHGETCLGGWVAQEWGHVWERGGWKEGDWGQGWGQIPACSLRCFRKANAEPCDYRGYEPAKLQKWPFKVLPNLKNQIIVQAFGFKKRKERDKPWALPKRKRHSDDLLRRLVSQGCRNPSTQIGSEWQLSTTCCLSSFVLMTCARCQK